MLSSAFQEKTFYKACKTEGLIFLTWGHSANLNFISDRKKKRRYFLHILRTYPSESSPHALQRATLMTAEPIPAEGILCQDHAQTDKHCIGDTYLIVTAQTVATEDETADDGLQQVVGETHPTEGTEVFQHAAHPFKGIPGWDHCRDYEE